MSDSLRVDGALRASLTLSSMLKVNQQDPRLNSEAKAAMRRIVGQVAEKLNLQVPGLNVPAVSQNQSQRQPPSPEPSGPPPPL